MKNKTLLYGALGAGAFWLMGKYRAFQSLELSAGLPRNFRLNNLTTLEFDLPLQAFNGSSTAVNVGGVDMRVFSTGKRYIGRAIAATPQRIGPGGITILTTRVFINVLDLASALPDFVNGVKDQTVEFSFSGNINVEGFYTNIDIPSFRFNLPKFR